MGYGSYWKDLGHQGDLPAEGVDFVGSKPFPFSKGSFDGHRDNKLKRKPCNIDAINADKEGHHSLHLSCFVITGRSIPTEYS